MLADHIYRVLTIYHEQFLLMSSEALSSSLIPVYFDNYIE